VSLLIGRVILALFPRKLIHFGKENYMGRMKIWGCMQAFFIWAIAPEVSSLLLAQELMVSAMTGINKRKNKDFIFLLN